MRIYSILDCSTGHLCPATREWMDEGEMPVVMGNDYGWLVTTGGIPGDAMTPEAPQDLQTVIDFARSLDLPYIRFDAEADRVEHLPWYES